MIGSVQNQYYNKITRNIKKLKTYKLKQQMGTLEEKEPTDITGFLQDNYKNIMVLTWKEAIQETDNRFQDRMMRSMHSEWESNKKKMLHNIKYGIDKINPEVHLTPKFITHTPNKMMMNTPLTPVGGNNMLYDNSFSTPIRVVFFFIYLAWIRRNDKGPRI